MATANKTSKPSKTSKTSKPSGTEKRAKVMNDLRPSAADRTGTLPGTEAPAAPKLDILAGKAPGEGEQLTGERIMVARRLLSVSPSNPRKTYDEAGLKRLATSIRETGLLHPLSVTPPVDGTGKRYVLAGSRRLHALDLLNEEQVPCIETMAPPWQVSGVENEDRQDVPWADMTDYLRTLADMGLTYKAIGDRIGKSEKSVQRAMSAAKRLNPAVYEESRRAPGSGSYLMTLAEQEKDHAKQAEAWAAYLAGGGGVTGKAGRRKGSKNGGGADKGPKRPSQGEARKTRETMSLGLVGREVEPLDTYAGTGRGELGGDAAIQDAYLAGIIVGLDLGTGVLAPGDLPQWVHNRIDAVRKAASTLGKASRKAAPQPQEGAAAGA